MENAKKRMQQAEQDYLAVKKDNVHLEELLNNLKEISDRKKTLSDYYFNQWIEDYSLLEESDFQNAVTNEDAIYEEIVGQYDLIKKILLVCAEYINTEE